MTGRETADEVETAALTWLWRRQGSGWSAQQEAEFQDWLSGSPARQGAFLRAEAAWASLDRLTWQEAPRARPDRRRFMLFGGAAAAAAVAAGAVFLTGSERHVAPERQVLSVDLADGSAATLNVRTDLSERMGDKRREVTLRHGEAFFRVRPDRERPFIVAAGNLRVQAVGTAFSVSRDDTGARVVVTEGVVEAWLGDRPGERLRLNAGHIAEAVSVQATLAVSRSDGAAERRLAWRQGRIDLDGETLAEAVQMFNLYNRTRLVVADPALADKRLYGVFEARDPAGFARTAGLSLGVPVRTDGEDILIGKGAGV